MARTPKIEGWLRQLEDGVGGARLEIFLKVEGYPGLSDRKIRASGLRREMEELRDWFEEKTGLVVNSPILPRRVPTPIPGSMTFPGLDLAEPTTQQAQETQDA